jgi:hypothetical protein
LDSGGVKLQSLETQLHEGPASLVYEGNRLFRIPNSAVGPAREAGDLTFFDEGLAVGDWVLAFPKAASPRALVVARVNRVTNIHGRRRAMASLFWYFRQHGRALDERIRSSVPQSTEIGDTSSIRRLISRLSMYYRIGFQASSLIRCTKSDI